jgi:hypothetical protein
VSGALLRFWWVVALGAFLGLLLAAWMVYELPSFTPKDKQTWTATARLLVTSSEGQYVRISVPRSVETGTSSSERTSGASGRGGSGALVVDDVPNVQPLLTAANLYPLLIESDDVAKLRTKMFGKLRGSVRANAYSAVSTPQRFSPAQLPVIDIFATSGTSRESIALADATAKAFKSWIRAEQDRAGVTEKARILIQQLQAPGRTFPTGGPSYGIPVLVALAVVAAFGMLAILLDQLVPRGARVPQVFRWG